MRLSSNTAIEITEGPSMGEMSISFTAPNNGGFTEIVLPRGLADHLISEVFKFQQEANRKELLQRLLEERLYWQPGVTGQGTYVSKVGDRRVYCRWNPLSSEYDIRELHTGKVGSVRHWPAGWSLQRHG